MPVLAQWLLTLLCSFIEEDKAAKFEKKAREAGQQDRGPGQQRRETLQYYYGQSTAETLPLLDVYLRQQASSSKLSTRSPTFGTTSPVTRLRAAMTRL